MKQLTVEFRNDIKNNQLDNYGVTGNEIWFQVRDTGNKLYNLLILTHALVEFILTQSRGVPLSIIDKFDAQHPESEEPGDEVNSPYRNEHGVAIGIERIMCAYMNIPWKTYEEQLIRSLGDDQ